MRFSGLPAGATVRIFNARGEAVTPPLAVDSGGRASWLPGSARARGVYLFRVTGAGAPLAAGTLALLPP